MAVLKSLRTVGAKPAGWRCANAQARGMPVRRVNPSELHSTPGYHHATLVPSGSTFAFLAGQMPLDREGRLVGPDVETQVAQVARNAIIALRAVGASPADVIRATIYVAGQDQERLGEVAHALDLTPLAPAFTAAATLLGVASLAIPGQIVEVELTAAIDSRHTTSTQDLTEERS